MKTLNTLILFTAPQAFLFGIYGVVMIVLENVYLFYLGFVLIVFYTFVYLKWVFKLVKKLC